MKEVINKKCLELNFYDYLTYCRKNGPRRGVGVITDKQSVFYTELFNNEITTHEWIAMDLENTIHQNNPRKGIDAIRRENIHYFSLGQELIVDLPSNGDLTKSEYLFLYDILKQIDKYNRENNTKTNILIACVDENHFTRYNPYDINNIIIELKDLITKDIEIEDEIIIGKDNNKDNIINNMIYQINIKECNSINDLINIYNKIVMYYNDNYYKKYVVSLFDNIDNVIELLKIIVDLKIDINSINFNYLNIEEKLVAIINDYYNKLDYKLKEINGIIKNSNIVQNIKENKEEINNLIDNKIKLINIKRSINNQINNLSSNSDIKIKYLNKNLYNINKKLKVIESKFEGISGLNKYNMNKSYLNFYLNLFDKDINNLKSEREKILLDKTIIDKKKK